jgi:nucleotide-binding universal stress UspA family protein
MWSPATSRLLQRVEFAHAGELIFIKLRDEGHAHTGQIRHTDPEPLMYQRILVPIDGSETSDFGLDEAIALATVTGGRLQLFHAIDNLSVATGYESYAVYAGDLLPLLKARGEKLLDNARNRAGAAGVMAETALRETVAGRLTDLVLEQAALFRADLIVIGTHGRRGFGRLLLGSDAEQIVRASPIPVLLVRCATCKTDAPMTLPSDAQVTAPVDRQTETTPA